MNWLVTFHIVSLLVFLEGIAITFSVVPGVLCRDPAGEMFFLGLTGVFTMLCGLAGFLFTKSKGTTLPGLREGFAAVGLTWIICAVFGALPYVFCTGLFFPDAFFEAASGITTTGSSILSKGLPLRDGRTLKEGIESLSHGVLFWRSLSQWIGGGGIVVFSLAIIPFLGTGSQALYNAEVPGVKNNHDQFTPRVATTAKIMFGVYLVLTALLALLLWVKMDLFDSVCHALATMATGGFSTKNASIGHYNSVYIDVVITVFMFLAGCNFILLFRLVKGMSFREYFSEEHKVFTGMVLGSSLLIAVLLLFSKFQSTVDFHLVKEIPDALRKSVFQVVSLISTTGFSTADYMEWPKSTHMLILFLMFSGACAGSTAGGFKVVRLLIMAKSAIAELKRCVYPRSVQLVKLDRTRIGNEAWRNAIGFSIIYFAVLFFTAFLLPFLCEMDPLTALSASITAISNVGPGLGKLGPSENFAWVGTPAKLLLALEMIAGRLELYTILILFMPSFWKR